MKPSASKLEPARRLLERGDPIVALAGIWLAMLVVQNATPNIIGIDGYYHIKFASLMWREGVRVDFPYLPLTILNEQAFTDHHLLYHIFLMPFALGDLKAGAKLAGLLSGVAAIFGVYWLMARLKVRYPLIWLAVLLASAEWFLVRQNMTRRQSQSLLLLVLATWLLLTARYRWLALVGFLYAWLFDGFVLLIAVVGVGLLSRLIVERRIVWPLVGWTLLGLGAALVINPYFPNNVTFTYLHVLPKIQTDPEIRVGTEWYPYPLDVKLRTSWLSLAVVPLGLLPALLRPGAARRDAKFLILAGLALLFGDLYWSSRRFIEYSPAFAVLLCAYSWSHLWSGAAWRAPACLLARLPLWTVANGALKTIAAPLLAMVVVAGLGWQLRHTIVEARLMASDDLRDDRFQAPIRFIAENSPSRSPLFHTDWDEFPELFFHSTHNTYMVGLDPTYMAQADRGRYLLWRSITRGEIEHPSEHIRTTFGASWVLTDRAREHQAFIGAADRDPGLQRVLETPYAVVYRLTR